MGRVIRKPTHLFSQHPRQWQKNRYVYPVISRRSKGLSIGINLNVDRICNFDCVYCCVDRSASRAKPHKTDLALLRDELATMLSAFVSGEIWADEPLSHTPDALRRLNDIAFSGDGEPTSSAEFLPACHLAADLLAQHALSATKLVLITNATLLDRPAVQDALRFLDVHNGEIWAKLDAGNERLYEQIIKTTIPFSRILDNIRHAGQTRDIVIQSMFLRLNGHGPSQQDIADYAQRLRELVAGGCRIQLVQAYTVARPVFQTHVTPLPDADLDHIAAEVRAAGIACEAFYK